VKLFDLYAELGLDASGFERGVKKASGMGKSLASSLRSGLGGAAGYVGKQVSATTIMMGHLMADAVKASAAAGKQMVSVGMQYNAQMETYQTNFRTMLDGSAEAAQALTAELEDMAAATPFAMTDLADATQTLLAFGQDSSTVMDTLQSLGDIAMGDSQKLQSLTLAFAQASSSGKLMGQDLMQMVNAGFNPLLTISEKTGASMGDLKEFMSNGKASVALRKQMREAQREIKLFGDEASDGAKMLVQMSKDGAISADLLGQVFAIETSPGGRFYGAMEAASKTFNGLVSTLEDDSRALLGKVFKPLSDWMTDDLLPKGIDLIGVMDKAFDSGGLAAAVKAGGELISQYFGEWGEYALDAGAGLLANVLTGLTGDTVNKDAVKAELESVWTDATGTVEAFTSTAGSVFTSILNGLAGDTDNKNSVSQDLAKIWTDAKADVQGFIDAGSGVLNGIWQGLTGDEASEKGITDEITGWIGAANESISGFTSAAGGLLGTIYEQITGLEPTAENVGSTLGGVISAGADGLNGLLNGASTFMTDLSTAIGDDDAGAGEKVAGVFGTGIDAMGNLVVGAGSLMADLYAAITGDTESASKIKAFFQTTFEQPFDLLEGVVEGYGILIDELIAMLPGAQNEEGEDVVTQALQKAAEDHGMPVARLGQSGYTPAAGPLSRGEVESHGYYEPDRPLDWWYEKHGGAFNMFGAARQAQANFQGDERASREAGDALGLLQQAVTMLTEAAASLPGAAAAAVSGAKVVLNGEDVGEIILPIIAAGLARELAPSRYTGGER
jgi:tape measure domain-containing protein